jgi:hypothetical protein
MTGCDGVQRNVCGEDGVNTVNYRERLSGLFPV